jgi:ribosome-associated protein
MDSKKLAIRCGKLADDKKAENIVIMDMRSLTAVADYFVICTGTSEPHLRAILDELTERLQQENHVRPRAIDGAFATAWVVLDYADVIVHIMRGEQRDRYNLEGLWNDAPRLSVPGLTKSRTQAKRPLRSTRPKATPPASHVGNPHPPSSSEEGG